MLIRILRGALPLAIVAIISRFLPREWASLSWGVLLGLQIFLGRNHLHAGNMIVWTAVCLLSAFLVNDALALSGWMDRHATVIFYAVFAATGFASVLLRRPFSIAHARLTVPKEYWDNKVFFEINRTVSLVWSSTFLICAVLALYSHLGPETTCTLCYGLIVATMIFTDRYPALMRKRRADSAIKPLAASMG